MKDIFEIRDYTKDKRGRLIWISCLICNRDFQIPYIHRKAIKTCCKYCQELKISWAKNKGKYRLCKVCNKPIWCQPRKTHEYCSKQCKNLAVTIYSWKRNSTMPYTGKKKYYGPNWLMQRRRARKRDQYKCQICGIHEKEYGQELSVHHNKPFVYFEFYEEANRLQNLISLCESCHRQVHKGEQHPSSFCLDKIKFTNHRNVVWTQQQKKAQQVLELLLNTDLSLREISDQTGLSYGNVRRMYRGDSWKMLYERSPQSIRPRRKNKHN